MSLKPWKILESNHARPRIRIDKCELPNGKLLDATVMEFRSWANVVAITKDGKVVLVRQYRHGAEKEFLEFPGGIEFYISPADFIANNLVSLIMDIYFA